MKLDFGARTSYPPGGVIKKLASVGMPKDVVAQAVKFGQKVDASGVAGKKHRIIGGYIVQADKSLVPPYTTWVRAISPQVKWITSAYTDPFAPDGDTVLEHLYPPGDPIIGAGLELGGLEILHPNAVLPEEHAEFDEKRVTVYAKAGWIGVEGNIYGASTHFPQKLCLSRYHTAVVLAQQTVVEIPGFTRNKLIAVVCNGASVERHPWDSDKDPEEPGVPATPFNYMMLVLTQDDLQDAFPGAEHVIGSRYLENSTTYRDTDSGLANRPSFFYVLQDEETGKYDKVVLLTALQHINTDRAGGYTQLYSAFEGISQGHGVAPTGREYQVGHGVAMYNLAITPEQLAAATDSKEIPITDRLLLSSHKLITAYDLPHTGQTYEGYRELPTIADNPQTAEDESEFVPLQYATVSERNHITCFVGSYQQRREAQPLTPKPLKPGQRAPYYGPPQVMMAVTTVHFYQDPPTPDKEFPYEAPAEPIQSTRWMVRSHKLFVGTISGTTYSETEHTLEETEHWVSSTLKDENGDLLPAPIRGTYNIYGVPIEVSFSTPPEGTHNMHYFYLPDGVGIPAVITPVSEYEFLTNNVPLWEQNLPFGVVDTAPCIGYQDVAGIEFAIFYPTAGNGFEKVVYGLGGYMPPRPIMYGVTSHAVSFCGNGGTPAAEFWYNRAAYSPASSYFEVEKVVSAYPVPDPRSYEDLPSPGFAEPDVLFEPGDADPEAKYFTSRRHIRTNTDQQRIHGRIGNGRLVVLATNNAGAGAVWFDWAAVVVQESTGAFVEARGVIPRGYDPKGYPLESSTWINVNVLQLEESNADGDITQEAVLVVSVDRSHQALSDPSGNTASGHKLTPESTGRPAIMMVNGGESGKLQAVPVSSAENGVDTQSTKFISRDGGRTWELFLENMPGDIYCLGNMLASKEHTI